jgi:hypothetical protein
MGAACVVDDMVAESNEAVLAKIVSELDRNGSVEVAATLILSGGYTLMGYIIGLEAYRSGLKASLPGIFQLSQLHQGTTDASKSVQALIAQGVKDTAADTDHMCFRRLEVNSNLYSLWRIRLTNVIAWTAGHTLAISKS